MKDKNGQNIAPESLISIKSGDKIKYYYVTNCSPNEQEGYNSFNGYRVNKNFEINQHDKNKGVSRLFLYMLGEEITLIDPMPAAFLESLRTLHFWVSKILEEFGVMRNEKYHFLLRAVKFENGSYGIIQNRMYNDNTGIDPQYEIMNVFEDLTYEELCEKWNKKKKNIEAENGNK